MAGGLVKQLVPLGVMFFVQKYDLEAMGYLDHVRAAFAVMQVFLLSTLYWTYRKIMQMDPNAKKIDVPAVKQMGQEIKPAMQQTPQEYDLSKLGEQIQQMVIGFLVLGFIHYKWGYVLPLVLQTVTTPMQVLDSPLVKIHVGGRESKGDLKRPFPPPNPFGLPDGLLDQQAEKPKKAKAEKAAEKAKKLEASKPASGSKKGR